MKIINNNVSAFIDVLNKKIHHSIAHIHVLLYNVRGFALNGIE